MPEKQLSQIPRPLREQYEKGKQAFERNNFEYALAIFTALLKQEPAFFDCRQALRASQFKKSGGSSTIFKRMLGGATSSPMLAKGQLALMKQPVDALDIAEQILNSDPNSASGHKLLGEAAMLSDLPKTAILSLEIVVKNNAKDEEAKKSLARAYSAAGQGDKAEAIFQELIRLHPSDLKLVQELKDISAKKTLKEGGYEALSSGTGSYRDILKDKEGSVALEQEGRQVKGGDVAKRMIDEAEVQLTQEPRNVKLLRTVAELHEQQKDYDKALETYQRILDLEGAADVSLLRVISDTKIKRLEHIISQLDPQSTDFAEKSQQLNEERTAFLLSEAQKRVERYPNDLALRFDLGKLYFSAGKIREAIQEFQKAQNNPNKRIQAMAYLGQCFAARGMNDMAATSLQTAIKEKLTFDDEKKEMIYALGGVYEKMSKKEDAIEQYKVIYQIDSGYKDVADKVESFYSGNA